jgi:hypothetical protein
VRPVEVNLEELDAGTVLEEIATGQAPWELLPFVVLMNRGGEGDIIKRWREIVTAEADSRRRGEAALVSVFAPRVGREVEWAKVMEGLTMIESPFIAELLAGAEARAQARGKLEGKIEGQLDALLRLFRSRAWPVATELAEMFRDCRDQDQFGRWFDAALAASSVEQFRQQTGL